MAEPQHPEESPDQGAEQPLPEGARRIDLGKLNDRLTVKIGNLTNTNEALQMIVEEQDATIVELRAALVEATSSRTPPRAQTKRSPKAAPKRP